MHYLVAFLAQCAKLVIEKQTKNKLGGSMIKRYIGKQTMMKRSNEKQIKENAEIVAKQIKENEIVLAEIKATIDLTLDRIERILNY